MTIPTTLQTTIPFLFQTSKGHFSVNGYNFNFCSRKKSNLLGVFQTIPMREVCFGHTPTKYYHYSMFHHCKFLLFADDLKMYKNINTINDSEKLQNDLRFESWCRCNLTKTNTAKCSQITFTKRKNSLVWNYNIDSNNLSIRIQSHVKNLV